MKAGIIRPAGAQDAGEIAAILAPVVERTAVSFEVEPSTVGEMGRRIAEIGTRLPWLVCESAGQILGYAYAGITLPTAQSVALHEFLGFMPVGVYHEIGYKLDARHYVGWWHLALGERGFPPDDSQTVLGKLGPEPLRRTSRPRRWPGSSRTAAA